MKTSGFLHPYTGIPLGFTGTDSWRSRVKDDLDEAAIVAGNRTIFSAHQVFRRSDRRELFGSLPEVLMSSTGKAAIVFSVAGEDFYPSAAYATLDAAAGAGPIVITGPGLGPDDGFSGYVPFIVSRVARWGVYSAAVADEHGNLWLATESINPPLPPETQLPPGALAANFGTFITEVKP